MGATKKLVDGRSRNIARPFIRVGVYVFWWELSIFVRKFQFLTKKFDFTPRISFFSKISIFVQKFQFLSKDFDFVQKVRSLSNNSDFVSKNFVFFCQKFRFLFVIWHALRSQQFYLNNFLLIFFVFPGRIILAVNIFFLKEIIIKY